MAGLLEQFSKGLFGLAPTPAPNGVFGQVLDSAAQWGRGVQDKAANIQTTLADLLRNPSNALPNIPPQTLANLLQQPVTPEQKQNIASKALDFGMEFGPLATVWHGSPHLFNKFDMSKIGTGEGAQAYGHGLYFAEHPATASTYASKLSNGGAMPMPPIPRDFMVDGARYVKQDGGLFKQVGNSAEYIPVQKTEYGEALRKAQQVYETKANSGNLYKVDLPDEHIAKMLDWDKPLSQQSPEVQKAMSAALKKHKLDPKAYADSTGSEIYKDLAWEIGGTQGQEAATGLLKKLGMPGIKYLDQNSRAGGAGTSNFVVFDDKIPKIIGRE